MSVHPYEWTVGYQPPETKDRISAVWALTQDATWNDEWGTQWSHALGGVGANTTAYPINCWSQLDDYLANSFPDPLAPGRLDDAAKKIEMFSGNTYNYGVILLSVFERLHCLRGMQNLFMDFYTNPQELERLADTLVEYILKLVRSWAKIGADSILLTDDWGTQTSLMISIDLWRKFFKARYKTIFDEIHRCGMDVFLHSCGNVTDIIPDLIDVGLDVLDPIQPSAMDQAKIAREFGGKITFCGAIDDQHLLSAGSPQEVKDQVRRTIDLLGKPYGNSYIVAPANVVTPEVPFENLRALFEACYE